MADPIKNRWVVILNRSPKGPLTQDEVKALLDKKLLRLNDLAFQLAPDGSVEKSEWKLLWQFPEFNRRGQRGPDVTPQPQQAVQERRAEESPEETKKRILENLPADIAAINPEDLIAQRRAPAMSEMREDSEAGSGSGATAAAAAAGRSIFRFAFAGGLISIVAFLFFFWWGSASVVTPRTSEVRAPSGESVDDTSTRVGTPLRNSRPSDHSRASANTAIAPVPAPRERENPFTLNPPTNDRDSGRIDSSDLDWEDEGATDEDRQTASRKRPRPKRRTTQTPQEGDEENLPPPEPTDESEYTE